MNLVSENINEAIKHLKPKSEEEIKIALKTKIDEWIEEHDIVDGITDYLNWTYDTDNRDSLVSDIFSYIPKDILHKAIFELMTDYINMI